MAIAYRVTEAATGSNHAGGCGAILALVFALCDRTIRTYACDFLSEPLALMLTTMFVFVAVVWQEKHRPVQLALAACLFSAMVLSRSMLVFWLPGVLILIALSSEQSKKLLSAAMFLTVFVLLAGPWGIRNCLWLDRWMPMGTQGTISLLGGYSDEAMADAGIGIPKVSNGCEID